jgi:hypothetical protein
MLTHNGKIAIPDRDPKTWRSKGRKRRQQPALASAIVHAGADEKRRGPAASDDPTPPARSAIVEPKRKPNTMLSHLLDHDGSDEEHRRRGELADKLFRTIVQRAAKHRD